MFRWGLGEKVGPGHEDLLEVTRALRSWQGDWGLRNGM